MCTYTTRLSASTARGAAGLPRRDDALRPRRHRGVGRFATRNAARMRPARRFVALLPRRPGGGAAIASVASVGAAARADAATPDARSGGKPSPATQTTAKRVPAPQRA